MSKGGRGRDPIRDYVNVLPNDSKKCKCKYCSHEMYNQVRTMRSHLASCEKVSEPDKITIKSIIAASKKKHSESVANKIKKACVDETILGKRLRFEMEQDSDVKQEEKQNKNKKHKPNSILDYTSNYYFQMSDPQQKMGIKLLVNMIVRTPLPITIVENEYFIRYSMFLNGSFKIPNYEQMTKADGHLITFHQLVVAEVESILKEMGSVTLGLDGSSDGNGNPIEHIIAARGEHGFLLDEVHMHRERKTAERLHELLKASKAKLDALGVRTEGLNRDNEAKMGKTGELFYEEEKVDDVGCASHILHLVVGGFFAKDVRAKFAKDCSQKVLDHYRNSLSKQDLIAVKRLPADAKFGIPIGEDGRWGSHYKGLTWMKENKQDLKQHCINDELNKSLTVQVKDLILNESEYWEDLDYTLTSLFPLDKTLRIYERDNMNPGEVLYRYIMLKFEYKNLQRMSEISRTEYRLLIRLLDEKWQLMRSPLHYAVYLIDPRFRSHPLTFTEVRYGEDCLKRLAGDKWDEWNKYYIDYHGKRYPFNDESFNIGIGDDPRKCYEPLTRAIGYKEYAEFCVDKLNINGTSCKLERSFKPVRLVHTSQRRSLKEPTLKMLVYDHVNLAAIEKYRGRPFI